MSKNVTRQLFLLSAPKGSNGKGPESGLLYREKAYLHDYPHCWRTDHPLLYYAMDSWFVRMTAVKEKLLEFNDGVEWAPDWVGEGRFGEWLRNVKDWLFPESAIGELHYLYGVVKMDK